MFFDSPRNTACIAALATLLLGGCGNDDDGGPMLPCGGCGRDEVCVQANPPETVSICSPECQDASDCSEPGRACLEDLSACSLYCQDDLCCPEGEECNETCRGSFRGECFPLDCSNECDPDNEVCDATLNECFPENGLCRDERPRCPDFGLEYLGLELPRDLCGDDGFCRIPKPREALPPDLRHGRKIEVTSPLPGDALRPEAIEFRWEWEQRANDSQIFGVVLTVMRSVDGRPPKTLPEMQETAIWTAGAESGTSLNWDDGVTRQGRDSPWTKPPEALPQGEPLYLAIVGFDPESKERHKIAGRSDLIPFQVGAGVWAEPGDACSDEGEVLGECQSPRNYMICESARCRVLCLSRGDCGLEFCQGVTDGLRFCTLDD